MANAHHIVITNKTATTCTVSWTPKNTSALDRSYVFIGVAPATMADPATGTDYAASAVFGSGDRTPNDSYCVAKPQNDSTMSVNITNLGPATAYCVSVCDSVIVGLVYDISTNTDNPLDFTTLAAEPTVQASGITISAVTATGFSITASDRFGDGEASIVWVKTASSGMPAPVDGTTYANANSVFGSGDQIGSSGWYAVYFGDDIGSAQPITGLSASTAYRIAITAVNGNGGIENYLISTATGNPVNQTTAAATPTIQSTNLLFGDSGTTTIPLAGLTRGNGAKVAIFVKAVGSGSPAPLNGVTYAANVAYGSGDQIEATGWRCVYNGASGSPSLTLTDVPAGTEVRWKAVEYNGTAGSEVYLQDDAAGNPANASSAPGLSQDGSMMMMGVG